MDCSAAELALIATTIARRPFLTGEDGPWVEARRERLRDMLVRALDCRVEALLFLYDLRDASAFDVLHGDEEAAVTLAIVVDF